MELNRPAAASEPSFSEGREWRMFAHIVAQIFLAFALFMGVWRLSDAHGKRYDLTTEKIHSLSDKSREVLDGLDRTIEIYSLIDRTKPAGGFTNDGVAEIHSRLDQLLWQIRDHTDRVQCEIIDVHRQPQRIQELQKDLGVREENLVLVLTRDEGGQIHQKSLSLRDLALAPTDWWSGQKIAGFKGEEAVIQAIRTVTAGEVIRICFTTGHGELDAAEKAGLIKAYLENEAYVFDTIDLRQEREVPADVRVLVVAGGDTSFEEAEAEAVRDHLKRGGSLLFLSEPGWKSGLEDVIDEVGIEVKKGIVMCEERLFVQSQSGAQGLMRGGYVSSLMTPVLDPAHAVTSKLAERRSRIELQFFCSVGRSNDDPTGEYTGLVTTFDDPETEEPESWVWTNWESERDGRKTGLGPDDKAGPVDVAAAVTKYFGDPKVPATPRARVVAVGDVSFLEDELIKNVANREFAYATLLWLAGRDPITLPPPEPKEWKFDPQKEQFLVRLVHLLSLPLGVFFLGVIVWIWRRY